MPAPRPTFPGSLDRQPDVFLSHSSVDKKIARRLACDLSSVGVDVWFDDWEIELGDSLFDSIGRGLRQSRFVAVVVSEHFITSSWCRKELELAFSFEESLGRKKVLPLLCDGVEVPTFLMGRKHQWITGDDYYVGITRIAGIIHGYAAQSVADHLGQPPRTIESVIAILLELGWNKRFYMNPDAFERHKRQIFDYSGLLLNDLQYDTEYLELISRMQKDGVDIFPIRWPFPAE
jgi:hypothetical protein